MPAGGLAAWVNAQVAGRGRASDGDVQCDRARPGWQARDRHGQRLCGAELGLGCAKAYPGVQDPGRSFPGEPAASAWRVVAQDVGDDVDGACRVVERNRVPGPQWNLDHVGDGLPGQVVQVGRQGYRMPAGVDRQVACRARVGDGDVQCDRARSCGQARDSQGQRVAGAELGLGCADPYPSVQDPDRGPTGEPRLRDCRSDRGRGRRRRRGADDVGCGEGECVACAVGQAGKGSRWINLASGLGAATVVLWRIWRSRWRGGSRCCGRI